MVRGKNPERVTERSHNGSVAKRRKRNKINESNESSENKREQKCEDFSG